MKKDIKIIFKFIFTKLNRSRYYKYDKNLYKNIAISYIYQTVNSSEFYYDNLGITSLGSILCYGILYVIINFCFVY